ncbi:MAG: flagellar export chaperone FliS [SAR324 cluster bacterium]|nr:flagellar export chaperone FliS [SAR324 cluster bacterium]
MQNTARSYQAYYKTNVETTDRLSLVIMLYDGMIRFMKKAVAKIEQGDVEEAHNYLVRAKEIISELLSTLRLEEGGELAQNLKNLYLYSFKKIVEANLKKDPDMIREVIQVMENLRQGWIQVKGQQTSQKQNMSAAYQAGQKKIRVQG